MPFFRGDYELDNGGRCVRWVYFIQVGSDGPIKVGLTNNITKRISVLQTGNPFPLHFLTAFRGTTKEAAEIRERFSHLRMHGEWLAAGVDLVDFIKQHMRSGS